ncbi:MAG TPA: phosphoglucomutase/phosphomannomutase family protein, partial [Candidatus Limiplasma sp.]|nr:phosphoglucomutase/phosphomannomutase family protein [Candidatus Limiplasma sp.]
RFIHPNEILCLLYNYLLKYKGWHGCAVRNLATTHLLDAIAAAYGEKCYEVPVGFKYVSAAMQEHNAVIGGESSGGLTVRGHIHGKDGIYAAALLVEMLSVTGKKLSELVQELYDTFGRRYMTEYDWAFDAKDKPRLLALLSGKELPVFPQAPTGVNDTDGRKILFANGWLIVRFSGTEPRLRVFCEMPTLAEAEQFSRVMADYLGLAFQEDRA